LHLTILGHTVLYTLRLLNFVLIFSFQGYGVDLFFWWLPSANCHFGLQNLLFNFLLRKFGLRNFIYLLFFLRKNRIILNVFYYLAENLLRDWLGIGLQILFWLFYLIYGSADWWSLWCVLSSESFQIFTWLSSVCFNWLALRHFFNEA
jgi:hypothetical protein